MKKSLLIKSGLLAGLFSVALVGQSHADLTTATATWSAIQSKAVEAKAAVSAAGLTTDAAAIAEAQRRSDVVDEAVAVAVKAYAALKIAIAEENADAAASAEADINAALQLATDALSGAVSEELAQRSTALNAKKKPGVRPGSTNPPNIFDIPWQSQGLRQIYEELFGSWWDASSFGRGSNGLAGSEGDVTPE